MLTPTFDFHVDISPAQNSLYEIYVRSQAGEQRAVTRFPLSESELELYLTKLENAILRSAGSRRKVLTPEEEAIQLFGRHLFDFLFAGENGSLLRECQRLADAQQSGVRIKLNIRDPRLAALPWEFLYDPRRRDYLCLDPHTPLVRYSELAQPLLPLRTNAPLRIRAMIAQPKEFAQLDVALEKRRIEDALERLRASGEVELSWVEGESAFDLQRAMRRGDWHIFHFIGHGGFDRARDEGFLVLADEAGNSDLLYASQLARLLRMQRTTLRLVLLNACDGARGSNLDIFSSTASSLLGDVPAVLAMQYRITDGAAKQFSQTFYEAVADNLPIDSAVADARNAINLRDRLSLEWGTPVLFMRSEDGQLFDLAASGRAARQASAQSEPEPPVRSETEAEQPADIVPPETQQPVEVAESHPLWQQIGIKMLPIPAGEFHYGDNKRKFTLPEFAISETPVTNQQYQAFVAATQHPAPGHWENGQIPEGKERHPVVRVSWHDAQAFCNWLGVDLPGEMQWEKAALGDRLRFYPWGDTPPERDRCNFGNYRKGTTAVDEYPGGASPYGVLDMVGNVWEWTRDCYDGDKATRVLRGGSFCDYEAFLRPTVRERGNLNDKYVNQGFRVVLNEGLTSLPVAHPLQSTLRINGK